MYGSITMATQWYIGGLRLVSNTPKESQPPNESNLECARFKLECRIYKYNRAEHCSTHPDIRQLQNIDIFTENLHAQVSRRCATYSQLSS